MPSWDMKKSHDSFVNEVLYKHMCMVSVPRKKKVQASLIPCGAILISDLKPPHIWGLVRPRHC